MDTAVNAAVGSALSLQQFNQSQDVQTSLLKRSLDDQSSHMAQLMESIDMAPVPATSGSLGTQINTYA